MQQLEKSITAVNNQKQKGRYNCRPLKNNDHNTEKGWNKTMKNNTLNYLIYDLQLSIIDVENIYQKSLKHFQGKQFSSYEKHSINLYFNHYINDENSIDLYNAICINSGRFTYETITEKAAMLYTLHLFETMVLYYEK